MQNRLEARPSRPRAFCSSCGSLQQRKFISEVTIHVESLRNLNTEPNFNIPRTLSVRQLQRGGVRHAERGFGPSYQWARSRKYLSPRHLILKEKSRSKGRRCLRLLNAFRGYEHR